MPSLPPFNGSYRRPSGSDGYPPAVGTLVVWTAVRPIVDAASQAVKDGVVAYTIGNVDHLRKHGDHTGHSYGKVRGRLYATDIMIHSAEPARSRLVAYLKSDADTRWIDFVNFAGKQYSYAGLVVDSSGDYHLHLSVNKGYESAATNAADLVHYVLTGEHLTPVSVAQKPPAKAPVPEAAKPTEQKVKPVLLINVAGKREIYLANGFQRRLLKNEAELKTYTSAGLAITTVAAGTDLDAFGKLVDRA